MTLYTLACTASERINAAVAHPAAFPVFVVSVVVGLLTAGLDATNLAISILTAGLLFLMATADARRSAKMEKKLDALAEVNPDVDEQAIDREVG